MSRQDKAVTERHAKILRELIKRPENKLCADCKRHDPRWASWNMYVAFVLYPNVTNRPIAVHSCAFDVQVSIGQWGHIYLKLNLSIWMFGPPNRWKYVGLAFNAIIVIFSNQQSIQKWGNVRVNLYWEAHLGSGHTPPDQ